jgi:predicted GNAT family N-acyltransferase
VYTLLVELEILRIKVFVRDQIVEKNFVDGDRMRVMNHLMKKIKMMALTLLLNYYYYP